MVLKNELAEAIAAMYKHLPDDVRQTVLEQLPTEQQKAITQAVLSRGSEQPRAYSTWGDTKGVIGPIKWPWKRWLPAGLLTMIVADQDVGKSALALWVSKTFVTGSDFPDGSHNPYPPGKVLWCETEAAQGMNVDRAEKWRIPFEDTILNPFEDPMHEVNLDKPEDREQVIYHAHRDEVLFTVVDSLRGATRGKEEDSRTGKVTSFLASLARDVEKPVALVHHPRKRSAVDIGEEMTLERVRGSGGLTQTARVIWAIDRPDITAPDLRRLHQIKNNLMEKPEPLGFRITASGLVFTQAPETYKEQSSVDIAAEFLQEILMNGRVARNTIFEEGTGRGISTASLNRAKKRMNVLHEKDKEDGMYYWYLPMNMGSI